MIIMILLAIHRITRGRFSNPAQAQAFHMKNRMLSLLSILCLTILIPAVAPAQSRDAYTYKPESQALYDTIVHMDSVYFDAYNKCDMAAQAALYADSIEFYHDKGGLETNKQALLDAFRKNICGKVTRVLVSGSIDRWQITRVISLH